MITEYDVTKVYKIYFLKLREFYLQNYCIYEISHIPDVLAALKEINKKSNLGLKSQT
jgi:hypothetical protein